MADRVTPNPTEEQTRLQRIKAASANRKRPNSDGSTTLMSAGWSDVEWLIAENDRLRVALAAVRIAHGYPHLTTCKVCEALDG